MLPAAMLGAALAWLLKPAPPTSSKLDEKAVAAQTTHIEEGSWSVRTWEYAPRSESGAPPAEDAPNQPSRRPANAGGLEDDRRGASASPPSPSTIIRYTEEVHGPRVSDSTAVASTEKHVEVVTAPPPRLALSMFVGQQFFPDRRLSVSASASVHLLGPVWLQAIAVPVLPLNQSSVSAGVRLDF